MLPVAAPRLLNDAGSKSDCVALCDRTMGSNDLERMWKWSWPDFLCRLGISLKGLGKTTVNLSQDGCHN